jgi:rare lipoprotein A
MERRIMLEVVALILLSQQPLAPVVHGVASYYTVESSGSRTASGKMLDDNLCTCAMRKGEFGGYYLVVAENGRSVVCQLIDRGPYRKGRVIDLSEAAMRQLHETAGTMHVKVYKISLDRLRDLAGVG